MGDAADDCYDLAWNGDHGCEAGEFVNYRSPRGLRYPTKPSVSVGKVTVTRETPKAILVDRGDGQPAQWVPRAHVVAESAAKNNGDIGELIITAWMAKQKGWDQR